jgi:methyl-accepting chemotaxis protein
MKVNVHSISFRLIAGGILAVLIPLLVVAWLSSSKASDALAVIAKDRAAQIAQRLADMVETVLEEEVKTVRALAANGLLRQALAAQADGEEVDLAAVDREMAQIARSLGSGYQGVLLVTAKGIGLSGSTYSGQNPYKDLNVSDRGYFQQARSTGKTAVSDALKSKVGGVPIVVLAEPILADGKYLGMVGTVLMIDALSEKVSSVTIGETGYGFMINGKGIIVAHPNKDYILELDLTGLDGMQAFVARMVKGETGADRYTFKGVDKICGFAPVPLTGWSVGATQNEEEFLRAFEIDSQLDGRCHPGGRSPRQPGGFFRGPHHRAAHQRCR